METLEQNKYNERLELETNLLKSLYKLDFTRSNINLDADFGEAYSSSLEELNMNQSLLLNQPYFKDKVIKLDTTYLIDRKSIDKLSNEELSNIIIKVVNKTIELEIQMKEEYNIRLHAQPILDILSEQDDVKMKRLVASNKYADESTLSFLADSDDIEVKKLVATNPSTPISVLNKLSLETNSYVRMSVLDNKNVTLDILDRLSFDDDESIREKVARNPKINENIINNLIQDSEIDVVNTLMMNKNVTKDIFYDLLINSNDNRFLIYLSMNPNIDEEIIDIILEKSSITEIIENEDELTDDDYEILNNLISCKLSSNTIDNLISLEDSFYNGNLIYQDNITEKQLETIFKNSDIEIQKQIVELPNLSDKFLYKIATDNKVDLSVKFALLNNPNTPIEAFEKLTKDENFMLITNVIANPSILKESKDKFLKNDVFIHIKEDLASNPNTSKELLFDLIKNQSDDIKVKVAENPNIDENIIAQLQLHKNREIGSIISKNPICPLEILKKNAFDEHYYVRQSVVSNPNCSPELLESMSIDKEVYVKRMVLRNPNINEKTLEKLSNDPDTTIRELVASNMKTPISVLEKLSHDEDINVRFKTYLNPSISKEMIQELKDSKVKNYDLDLLSNALKSLNNKIIDITERPSIKKQSETIENELVSKSSNNHKH